MSFNASSSSRTRIDQPSSPRISPLTVPTPTVYTRTPRSAAILAASIGSGPVVVWPSVSRMITADEYDPGATGLNSASWAADGCCLSSERAAPSRLASRGLSDCRSNSTSGISALSETRMPLPTAVPRCNWKRSIAASRSSLVRVGACTSDAVPANDTTPMRVLCGWSSMNARAAAWAAASRFGSTSLARMLPDTSMANMTVSFIDGRVMTAAGRATASSITMMDSRNSSGGIWRRMRWAGPIASLTMARLA